MLGMFRVNLRRPPCENICAIPAMGWPPMNGYGTALASIVLTFVACQSLPHFSANGEVRDIAINNPLSAAAVQVNGGDEIRRTNRLMTSVRITFVDYVSGKLSCRHKFSRHFYSGAETVLLPNESARLCFDKTRNDSLYRQNALRSLQRGIARSGLVQVGATSGHLTQNKSIAVAPPYSREGPTHECTDQDGRGGPGTPVRVSMGPEFIC